MLRQRPQNVVQQLPDKYNSFPTLNRPEKLFNSLFAQLRLQYVVKILFPKQIEPVSADASQKRVQEPRGKCSVCCISKGPCESHRRHASTARPSFGKALRVPGEESHWAQGAQLEQRAFHAPIRCWPPGSIGGNAHRVVSWISHRYRTRLSARTHLRASTLKLSEARNLSLTK